MPTQAHKATAVDELVAQAVRQLEADGARFTRVVRANPLVDGEPTLAVMKELALARRHALTAFRGVLAAPDHPGKIPALQWLAQMTKGLTALYSSMRSATRAPAASAKERRRAREGFKATRKAFLELDRALGCRYGCRS
jgi:hypothetical protein